MPAFAGMTEKGEAITCLNVSAAIRLRGMRLMDCFASARNDVCNAYAPRNNETGSEKTSRP